MSRYYRRELRQLHRVEFGGGGRVLHWHYNEFDDHNFEIHGHTLIYLFILLAVVLLATLLLLYARWFFRLRRPSSVSTTPLPISHSLHPCTNAPTGLRFDVINSLPITLHVVADHAQVHHLECCICLGPFEDGDKVKILPGCAHRYHSNCVDIWLSAHSNCPLCRLPIRI